MTLADLESRGQDLISDPLPEEPDHALATGNKTLATKRALAKAARWVVRPASAYPPESETTAGPGT
jgi:hypothetical protein